MHLNEQCINDKRIKVKGYLESIDQSPRTDSPAIVREGGHNVKIELARPKLIVVRAK